MNKQKLANGLMWISMAMLFMFTSAISLSKGFSQDNYFHLIMGGICTVGVFFCGIKGLKTFLDAFFNKK
tara:strand:+ start:493 stop:699 length:207 start_codon:yes stop_codon:yes gene_type:complete